MIMDFVSPLDKLAEFWVFPLAREYIELPDWCESWGMGAKYSPRLEWIWWVSSSILLWFPLISIKRLSAKSLMESVLWDLTIIFEDGVCGWACFNSGLNCEWRFHISTEEEECPDDCGLCLLRVVKLQIRKNIVNYTCRDTNTNKLKMLRCQKHKHNVWIL